jgi:hypothetical protein
MRKIFNPLFTALIAAVSLTSCNKETNTETTQEVAVSQETQSKIKSLGFGTATVQRHEGGYLVEGDIFLSEASLNERSASPHLIIASEEQYRTYNLVMGLPRSISISISGKVSNKFIRAVDGAIARYNAENLLLTFRRVASGGNINILIVNGSPGAYAGFPTSTGQPFSEITIGSETANYGLNVITTLIAHNIGHCIGFRHTDYMNQAFSCGSGSNEGQVTTGVGAIHIPGTPTKPDNASWMLACWTTTTDRPFNTNDKEALTFLY